MELGRSHSHSQVCDLTDPERVPDFIARSAEALGCIQILASDAGGPSRGLRDPQRRGLAGRPRRSKLFSMIRCSRAVAPVGLVITPQWKNIPRRRALHISEEEFFRQMAGKEVSLGRFGHPDEVASVVVFLAGERASYITGASVDVARGHGKYV